MILATENKRRSVKIRIDGKDKNGKNTTRGIVVLETDVEEVAKVITDAIKVAQKEKP